MRRPLVVLLSVIALFGTWLVGSGSLTAQDTDLADHPLAGTWELRADLGDGDTSCISQVVFTDEGAYIDVDCEGFVVIGTWEPTGDSTAIMSFTSFDPEGGSYTVRATVEVAADGQSFTAPFTFEVTDPATGEGSGQYGPGMATGTRLVAEAPGTPEGPVVDLFGQFGGTPEASPAS
ncbi:MAG TPA: hypothetical protein VEW66_02570 [Thermomicrobiales bacterium]|nr:hypothetical protein [Thermomicrobiales bacterium]